MLISDCLIVRDISKDSFLSFITSVLLAPLPGYSSQPMYAVPILVAQAQHQHKHARNPTLFPITFSARKNVINPSLPMLQCTKN